MACKLTNIYKEMIKSLPEGVKEKTIEAYQWLYNKGFNAIQLDNTDDIPSKEVLAYLNLINADRSLGGVVGVYYNRKSVTGNPDSLLKVVSVKYDNKNNKLELSLSDGTSWTFLNGSPTSKPSAKGISITIKELEGIQDRIKNRFTEVDYLVSESELRSGNVFGSRGNPNTVRADAYTKLEKDLWKNPEKMKELFEILVSNDQLDNAHTKYLRKLLSTIVDSSSPILNQFTTYINEKASKNSGVAVINKNNSKLVLNFSKIDKDNLAQEVYLHEIIHLSVEFALKYRQDSLGSVTNELANLYDKAFDYITIEKLIAKVGDVQEAKTLYNQMFKGKDSLSEFIALGMTNQQVKELLSEIKIKDESSSEHTSLFDKLIFYTKKLFKVIKGIYVNNPKKMAGDEALALYVSKLWEHNVNTIKTESIYNKITNSITDVRDTFDKTIVKTITKSTGPVVTAVEEFLEKYENNKIVQTIGVVWYFGKLINPFQSEEFNVAIKRVMAEYSGMLDKAFGGLGLGWLTAPENSLMQLINYIKKDDPLTVKIEKLALAVQKIDMFRQETIKRVGKKIKSSFKKDIGKKTQTALTRVLIENDVQSLLTTYDVKDIVELLKDDSKILKAIEKEYAIIDKRISDKRVQNYLKSQAKGLGYKLATGISGSSVKQNAYDIVTLRGTPLKLTGLNKSDFKTLLHSVDRLATLEGLLKTSPELKEKVSGLDVDGLETTLAIHSVYIANAIRYSKKFNAYNYPDKGEIKDTKDETIDLKIGIDTPEMVEKMKVDGYEKVEYDAPKGLAVYVNRNYNSSEFSKQAMAKINESKKLHRIHYTDDRAKELESQIITETANEDIEKQMQEVVLPVMDGFKATISSSGDVVYGYTIDKFKYADLTLQDNKAPLLLGKMIAEIEEKEQSHAMNDKVYRLILEDMNDNYKRGDSLYVEVGPDAVNSGKTAKKYADELWKNMPESLRRKIFKRQKGQKYVALRRDVADMYVGRRMPSVFNLKIPIVGKTVDTVMSANDKLRVVKDLTKTAGKFWQELVSMQKVDIVIRTPKVLIDNIFSNFNWAIALGQNPIKLSKEYFSLASEVNEYINKRKEVEKLKLEASVEKDRTKQQRLRLKANNIMKAISKNAIHEVYEAGLFTTIQQDVDDADLKAKHKIEKMIEKSPLFKSVSEAIPQVIKDGFSTLYMTEGTKTFNALESAMQYSDFIARVSLYKHLLNQGVNKNVAIKSVAEAFVNYNRLLPKYMAWAEKLGLEWFMRYTLGANKNLVTALRDKPTTVLLMSTLLDAPNPSDASIIEKDFSYAFKNPWDVAFTGTEKNILPPSSLELLGII